MMGDQLKQDGAIDEVVDDLMEDPDAPEKGNGAHPPQTIKNEPEDESRAPGA